jgi:hypothetical protein
MTWVGRLNYPPLKSSVFLVGIGSWGESWTIVLDSV